MSTSRAIPAAPTPQADLVEIRESEIGEVGSFIAAQSGRGSEQVRSHLRWFLLENPARDAQQPWGFALRSSGELVGCILCSPQTFCLENKKFILMGSSSFYVDQRYRGHGGRIFLQYLRLGNRWPLFGTSANAKAAALWKAAGANPIPSSDCEFFGILRWPPVAEEFAHRKNSSRILSRLAGSPISNVVEFVRPLKIDRGSNQADALRLLRSAEQGSDLLDSFRSEKVTALRDAPYLQWRYFSGRDPTVAVFAFRSFDPEREVLVTTNRRSRGYRGQINTINVLDVFPEVPPEEWLRIVGALIVRYGKAIDAVVLRHQDRQRQRIFCERGFRRRTFDAPNGWFLDKAGLLPTSEWYSVPADGDGLI